MKKTPLYDSHLALGARMVDFAGWQMPLQYATGISEEHIAVRTDIGLFDVSHMGELRITGKEAESFLAFSTLNDPSKLKPGRGQYSMLPNEHGGLVDDLYIYMDAEDNYLVVCNASNREAVAAQFEKLAKHYEVTIVDESDSWALLALQGPGAAILLARFVTEDLSSLKKNRKQTVILNGCMVDAARTGYTGEDGFELFCRPDDAVKVWDTLVAAGAKPCGLGARDSLRLEAGFPLYGHEFSADTNPLCTDYAWVVKDKSFFGREAMWGKPCEKKLVAMVLTQRGIARQGYTVFSGDKAIGEISSGTISPFTRDSIAMAWIDADYAQIGEKVQVEIRRDLIEAEICKPPFFES
ncbi:MAG: glycine cleavage system aminomethyltransferase GcvT [Trueperaceae bacterium]|nr:glycine cleavage system aminomethyltransferase GcvT [Trueperaceae bacterium]